MFGNRSKNFQKSFNAEQEKAEREEFAVALRRSKRIECQKKRRSIKKLNLSQEAESYDKLKILCSSLTTMNSSDEIIALLKSTKEIIIENSDSLKDLSKAGFSKPLCALLCAESDEIVEITTWLMCNWSSIDNESFVDLYKSNCFKNLLNLLTHHSEYIIENSLWSLSNFIAHSEKYYTAIIELGLLNKIEKFSKNMRFHIVITWLLKNISIYNANLAEVHVKSIVQLCTIIVQSGETSDPDDEIIWILSNLCHNGEDAIELMICTGLVDRSFNVCVDKPLAVLTLLGNIIVSSERFAQMLIEKGLMDMLSVLFQTKVDAIVCKVYWVLSNLIAYGRQLIWHVGQHSLCKAATNDFDKYSRLTLIKSLVFIDNLLKLGSSDIRSIADKGCLVERLVAVATCNTNDIIIAILCIFATLIQLSDCTRPDIPLIYHFADSHTASRCKKIKTLAYEIIDYLGEVLE